MFSQVKVIKTIHQVFDSEMGTVNVALALSNQVESEVYVYKVYNHSRKFKTFGSAREAGKE